MGVDKSDIVFIICCGRKRFKSFVVPTHFAILIDINSLWGFHGKFSFIISPNELKSLTRSKKGSEIMSLGEKS